MSGVDANIRELPDASMREQGEAPAGQETAEGSGTRSPALYATTFLPRRPGMPDAADGCCRRICSSDACAGIRRDIRDLEKTRHSVELVVSHDRLCRSGIDHAPDKIDRLALRGSTVDEISDEHGLPGRMTPSATSLRVPQLDKQSLKSIRVPVDVSNDVVVHLNAPGD
jgi:hypothetical protein